MNDDFFSEWCSLCIAGDYRDHPTGSHQRHVRERQQRLREHLAKRFTWRWEQVDTVKPLPRGSGQGPHLAPDGDQCHDDRGDGDHQR